MGTSLKGLLPKESVPIPSSMVTFFNAVQFQNAWFPIEFTELGIVMEVKPLHA